MNCSAFISLVDYALSDHMTLKWSTNMDSTLITSHLKTSEKKLLHINDKTPDSTTLWCELPFWLWKPRPWLVLVMKMNKKQGEWGWSVEKEVYGEGWGEHARWVLRLIVFSYLALVCTHSQSFGQVWMLHAAGYVQVWHYKH